MLKNSTRALQNCSACSVNGYNLPWSNFASRRFYNTNKKIGIIGGSGPDAGVNFMQKVLSVHKAKKGSSYQTDKDAADVVLVNNPAVGGPHGVWDLVSGKGDPVQDKSHTMLLDTMATVIDDLKTMKCDRFVVVCNTLHAIEPEIREITEQKSNDDHRIEFYSIIDPVKNFVVSRARHHKKSSDQPLRVALYGSLLTTDIHGLSPYGRMQAVEEVEEAPFHLVRHDRQQREQMQDLIDMIKREANSNVPKYVEIFQNWMARDKTDICILGCTEFSLLINDLEEPEKCCDPVHELAVQLMEQPAKKVTQKKSAFRIPRSTYTEDMEISQEKLQQL